MTDRTRSVIASVAAILATLAIVLTTWNVTRSQPVCHSVTEDSTPYDCDYHDHEWRTR